ncbi:MAG TPA: hypothetical protein VL404_09435 [Candidatus Eisenbacteria bacterium]|nr:hypothetical protein [Candidatus Eisenbacteria bacterium]
MKDLSVKAGVLAAIFALGALSFVIQRAPDLPERSSAGDPLFKMLGSAKAALGDLVFMRADSYFHKGLRPDLLKAALEDDQAATRGVRQDTMSRLISRDWIGRVYAAVNVSSEHHLDLDESDEMLPLLDISTRLNPHNRAAVLTASYWFHDRYRDTGRALEILKSGRGDNPDSWEIDNELGRIYFEKKKDAAQAAFYFRSALRKLSKAQEKFPFDPIRVRYQLAEAYRAAGRPERALIFYKEALSFYRHREEAALKRVLEKKIAELQTGKA